MKKTVTFYNKLTGEIQRHAILSEELVELNLQPNEEWLEGKYRPETYIIVEGVPVEISAVDIESEEIRKAWISLRQNRNTLLANSDWTQIPDSPADSVAWAQYRQELRDLPSNTQDPRFPVWPEKPE